MHNIQTGKYYTFISALLAFLLWGGWAFYINNGSSGNKSGITQGTCSFIITLLMTHSIAFQYNKLSNAILKTIFPPLITVSITGSILVSIHIIVGTPSVFYTVSPALTVALIFSFFTVYKLHSSGQKHRKMHKNNDKQS